MTSAARQALQHWTSSQIHDTVAAIARLPVFARSARESLVGRFIRYVIAQVREFFDRYHGSTSARYIVIAAIALILLVVIARIVTARGLDAEIRRRARTYRRGSIHEDFWMAAQRAAATGDHVAACHLLYAAVLDRTAIQEGLALHPSKTSGDYWRELRRRGSPAQAEFRLFARRFDRAMYGSTTPSAEDFNELSGLADRVLSARRAA
jgi:preprotein translocase subunit Sec61beta